MDIGNKIKCLREKNNLTQEQLAEKIGITRSMIAQIERGTKTITLPVAVKIADVFECKIEELF